MIDLNKIKKTESGELLIALSMSSLIKNKDDRFNNYMIEYDSDYTIDRIKRLRLMKDKDIFLNILDDLISKKSMLKNES